MDVTPRAGRPGATRPRALADRSGARSVRHGDNFLAELESVFIAIQAMRLRFPIVHDTVHRALLRRYPFAAFFRVRPATEHVVVLAVFSQRDDPARWPR